MNDFAEKALLTVVDKLVIGVLIVIAGYWLSRLLEKYKYQQNKLLEQFKIGQNRMLEKLRGEQALHNEYEVLRDQTALKHLQRQIEELYSPLLGLLQYGEVVNAVEFQKLPDRSSHQRGAEVRRYFVERYYLPLNTQVSELIRTKIYLLDSEALPESFKQFLMHAAQFEILYRLWKDLGDPTDHIPGIEYPKTFRQDVRNSLDQLRASFAAIVRDKNEGLR